MLYIVNIYITFLCYVTFALYIGFHVRSKALHVLVLTDSSVGRIKDLIKPVMGKAH